MQDLTMEKIKEQVRVGNFRFTTHGLERCIERQISPAEVKAAILSGEIIEDYPTDKYGPSCLIHGSTEAGRILHVHCTIEPVWIVTAYDPTLSPDDWEENYRRRRERP